MSNFDHRGGRRVRRSAEQWAEAIAAQKRCGLRVAAFCDREDLDVSSFYRWRRRLGNSPGLLPGPRHGPCPGRRPSSVPGSFVRVQVAGESPSSRPVAGAHPQPPSPLTVAGVHPPSSPSPAGAGPRPSPAATLKDGGGAARCVDGRASPTEVNMPDACPVVVRFVDGVELRVGRELLGEVVAMLRRAAPGKGGGESC